MRDPTIDRYSFLSTRLSSHNGLSKRILGSMGLDVLHRNFVTQADDSEHEDEDSKHGRNQINDFVNALLTSSHVL
jgi:hypothetical protein